MQEVSLDKILKEGQLIEIKFNEKNSWIKTTLCKAYESILEIEISQEEALLDDFMAIGDSLNCRCMAEGSEYLIEGWISRFKSESPQKITVQIHKATKIESVADERTYDVFIGCILRADPKEKGIFSIAKKISNHTITIGYKSGMELKEKMHLELLLPGNVTFRSLVEIEKIGAAEERKDFNVKISEPDILNRRILENFLIELENTKPEIFNKQNSFWKKNSKIGS